MLLGGDPTNGVVLNNTGVDRPPRRDLQRVGTGTSADTRAAARAARSPCATGAVYTEQTERLGIYVAPTNTKRAVR